MLRLKDIAARMDDCHVRTAKRWWKRINAECLAAKLPPVAPDVIGHGPHRWHDATAERLISLWERYYQKRGTTPQITRAKFAGKLTNGSQLDLLSWKQNSNQCPPAVSPQKNGRKPAPHRNVIGRKPAKTARPAR